MSKTQQQRKAETADQQQVDDAEIQRKKYIDEQTIRIEAEQEIKDRKIFLKQASQRVADKKAAEVDAEARAKTEAKDRAYVRTMNRAQRIAYRRRLTGGFFPDHIKDELDRMDGLKPDAVVAGTENEASTESLLAALRSRGIEALPVNKAVMERVPTGVGGDIDWDEENAAE